VTVQAALASPAFGGLCNHVRSPRRSHNTCCDYRLYVVLKEQLQNADFRTTCGSLAYEFQYDSFKFFMEQREAWNLALVVSVRNPVTHVLSMLKHERHYLPHPQPTLHQMLLSQRSRTFNRQNMMASVLSGIDQNASRPLKANLTRALEVIDSAYLVLVTEYMTPGLALLKYLMGKESSPPMCDTLFVFRPDKHAVFNKRAERVESGDMPALMDMVSCSLCQDARKQQGQADSRYRRS